MTDEKFVAKETERERKSMANSARKRKTHNGKSGCTLPHESMTRKELLSMNGEVQKVNMSKPMEWKEFLALSSSLQEAYIYQLVKKYDISMNLFGKMVKRSAGTVYPWMNEHPSLKKLFNSSNKMSKERQAKNKDFMAWIAVNDIPEEDKAHVDSMSEIINDTIDKAKNLNEEANTPFRYNLKANTYYTQAQVDELLLRQKVEIYESILDRLLDKKITLELKEVE